MSNNNVYAGYKTAKEANQACEMPAKIETLSRGLLKEIKMTISTFDSILHTYIFENPISDCMTELQGTVPSNRIDRIIENLEQAIKDITVFRGEKLNTILVKELDKL